MSRKPGEESTWSGRASLTASRAAERPSMVSTEDPLLDQQCRFTGGLEKQFGRAVGEKPDWFEKEWEETDW